MNVKLGGLLRVQSFHGVGYAWDPAPDKGYRRRLFHGTSCYVYYSLAAIPKTGTTAAQHNMISGDVSTASIGLFSMYIMDNDTSTQSLVLDLILVCLIHVLEFWVN